MNFLSKIGSKRILGRKYGNAIRRRMQKVPMSERAAVRRQLRNPGKNYGGKYKKIMGLRMDQNRVKVGIKPKYSAVTRNDIVGRFKSYKKFVSKRFTGTAGKVLIGGGAVVATMFAMGKGSVEKGADALVDAGESAWDLAETVGGSVEPMLKGLTKVIGGTASGLNFISDNFTLIVLGITGFVGYRILNPRDLMKTHTS